LANQHQVELPLGAGLADSARWRSLKVGGLAGALPLGGNDLGKPAPSRCSRWGRDRVLPGAPLGLATAVAHVGRAHQGHSPQPLPRLHKDRSLAQHPEGGEGGQDVALCGSLLRFGHELGNPASGGSPPTHCDNWRALLDFIIQTIVAPGGAELVVMPRVG